MSRDVDDETNPFAAPRAQTLAQPVKSNSEISLIKPLAATFILLGILVGLLLPAVNTKRYTQPTRPLPRKVIPSHSRDDAGTIPTTPIVAPSS
jgi:hypothetical protein